MFTIISLVQVKKSYVYASRLIEYYTVIVALYSF